MTDTTVTSTTAAAIDVDRLTGAIEGLLHGVTQLDSITAVISPDAVVLSATDAQAAQTALRLVTGRLRSHVTPEFAHAADAALERITESVTA